MRSIPDPSASLSKNYHMVRRIYNALAVTTGNLRACAAKAIGRGRRPGTVATAGRCAVHDGRSLIHQHHSVGGVQAAAFVSCAAWRSPFESPPVGGLSVEVLSGAGAGSVACEQCQAEKLVAFSCKKRGFCPSCGGRRMAETAALLADEVLPDRPLRQWVLSLPHALRFLLATNSEALTLVLGEVYRTISRHPIGKAGLTRTTGATGAVTLVQRFGSALNLNVHFHMVFLDGVY